MRQAELAELLGRKQAFVSKYESGMRGLDAVDFLAILDLTSCDVTQVIEGVRVVEEKRPDSGRTAAEIRDPEPVTTRTPKASRSPAKS